MTKLTSSAIRSLLGSSFAWEIRHHPKATGPSGMTIELVELDDGRVGNIVVMIPTSIAISPFDAEAQPVFHHVSNLLKAHGFSHDASPHEIYDNLLTALSGLKPTLGKDDIGFSYKELPSLGLIQLKFTYER